jgi:hypothetical protein
MKRLLIFAALSACMAVPAHAYYPEWPRTHFGTHSGTVGLFSADFNADGRPDVVAYTTSHTVLLSLAKPDRTFAAPVTIYTGTYLTDLILGDGNGDGKTDIIVSDTATNSLVLLPSNGNATFGTPIVTTLTMAPTEIASADFNDDGDVDIALRSYSGMILVVFTNDGAGHFAETWRSPIDETAKWVLGGDIDGDGDDDFVVRRSVPSNQYVMFFGRGDGTFDPPVTTPATAVPFRVVLGDLDEDGDLEILSVDVPSSVNVIVNTGSRTFAAASNYSTFLTTGSDAVSLVVAEVTGDDHPDVVAILASSKKIATLPGNGNGTLGTPEYAPVPSITSFTGMFPQVLTAADYTGDGRVDLAIADHSRLAMFANAAGDNTITLKAVYPTISTGQIAKFEVQFRVADGVTQSYPSIPPYPAGTITLKNGATAVATGSFANYSATIEVPSLPLGAHTITASYAGDANYRPQTSSGVSQKVITEKTTIELTASSEGQDIPYGEEITLSAHVVSPLPGSATGTWWLYTNGERSQYTASGANPYWWARPDDVGTHEYYVKFEGTETQPPASSPVFRQTVTKAQSIIAFPYRNLNTILRYGSQPEVRIDLRSDPHGPVPEGIVKLYDGSTLLATKDVVNNCCSGGITVTFNLPVLSVGVHHIHATYAGNGRFKPSSTGYERYTIIPAEGFVVDAYAAVDGTYQSVGAAGYFTLPENGHFVIYRKVGSQPWAVYDSYALYPSASIYDPTPNVVYAFRMEAYDGANHLVASSNADAAMIFPFTDKPLLSGLPVKAQHLQELIAATNILRTAAGLSTLTLSDAGVGQLIRLEHLTTLRSYWDAARAALGLTPFTHSNLPLGSTIQAHHFQELRDAMQ